ncbi:MAG: AbrB/MazE/SpoVT family DNA-binding domain-containing protein [Nanoarchaeota archaeon]
MGIAKITRNFQVTLPKDVRKIVGVKEGDEVLFIVDGNNVSLLKSEKDSIMAAAGIWESVKETGTEYQKRVRKEWRKRQKALQW